MKLLILKNYKISIFEYIKISYTLANMTDFKWIFIDNMKLIMLIYSYAINLAIA